MRPWFILAALALARIGFGYQFQTVAALGPDIVPRFHLAYAAFGWLIGAYMLPGAFVALPLGLLGRHLGDRIVLGGGLALMVAGSLVSAAGGGPLGIGIGRAVAGIGAVAMIVLMNKVLADWFSGARFLLAISITVAAYPIGVGLTQLVLPPVTATYGWQAGFLTDAILLSAPLLLFLAAWRPAPNAGAPHGAAARSAATSPAARAPRTLHLPVPREAMLLAIAGTIWSAYTAGFSGYISYVPTTLTLRGDSLALIGLVMTIATWGNVPATLAGSGLATRFGAWRVFLTGTLALVVGMAGTVALDWPVLWSVVIGIIGSIHPGIIMTVGTLSVRAQDRAAGMGIFYTVYYAGGTIGPALCGLAADAYGGPAGGVLAGSAISALAIPLYLLHRRLASHETMLVRA